MKTLTLNRDQFAQFIFSQNSKIEKYNFDLCHDIAKVVNYAYNPDNYRDENGQIITNKPVFIKYYLYIKKTGSQIFETSDNSIDYFEANFEYLNKYELTIIPNCDYLHGIEFCEVKQLK